jgi:hypothetical protein
MKLGKARLRSAMRSLAAGSILSVALDELLAIEPELPLGPDKAVQCLAGESSRSNSASAAKIPKMSLPLAVTVLMLAPSRQ